MKLLNESLLLYAVTDRTWLNGRTLAQDVEQTLKAGATFLQLREKDLPFDSFVHEAQKIKVISDKYHVPFVINDNVEVALAVHADGVHVGQNDYLPGKARALIGPDKILGVSAQTVEQAVLAQSQGADYLGVGAVFSTTTKSDADTVSLDTLRAICDAVSIPVIAIGGIHEGNLRALTGSGIQGVAVVSAIFASPNIGAATGNLLKLTKEVFQ